MTSRRRNGSAVVGRERMAVSYPGRSAAALAVLILAVSPGCRRPDEGMRGDTEADRTAHRFLPRRTVIGTSVEGKPIECIELGRGREAILILATIHGSEPAGTPLVRRLADYLAARPDLLADRRVLLMPVANPDGLARGTRHNARGVDLNRNFPAGNFRTSVSHGRSALSEPESAAIQQALQTYRPCRIVSIHQPVNSGDACIDYDGPAEALAEALAAHTDLPVRKLGGRPGSLGSYAGITLGIPIITVELPAAATDLDATALWRHYGEMLLAAIQFPEPLFAGADQAGE